MSHPSSIAASALVTLATALAIGLVTPRSQASAHSSPAVPVLMYHVITAAPPEAAYPDLFVSRSEFAAQVAWLSAHGYHAVTLRQIYESWHSRGHLPRRPIVFTFDDGYRSVHTNAFPILRSYAWTGVLNLTVRNNGGIGGLSTFKVHELVRGGWELGSHSLTHPDLTRLSAHALEAEVETSRHILRRRFNARVDFFCYPSGRYDAGVIAAVKAAGYLGATSTRTGLARANELYTLARVRVNAGDDGADLGAKLHALGA